MAGLYETTATLQKRSSNDVYGDPGYATGTAFACHVTGSPSLLREVLGESVDHGVVLVCEGDPGAEPGDRVTVDGQDYVVASVRRYRHRTGVHHVTIGAT